MRIIAGKHRSRKLIVPEGEFVRPTSDRVKESLFNILQVDIDGAEVADLYSGVGSLGIEAVSRGAASAHCVEKDRVALKALEQNVVMLKEEKRVIIMPQSVQAALNVFARREKQFDIILADPPYAKCDVALLDWILKAGIMKESSVLVIEHATRFDWKDHPGYEMIRNNRYRKTELSFFKLSSASVEGDIK